AQGWGVRPAACSQTKSAIAAVSNASVRSQTSNGNPAIRATSAASRRADGPQQPCSTPSRCTRRMCEPTTSYPCSRRRHAATDESTPPDIATRTEPLEDMPEMLRGDRRPGPQAGTGGGAHPMQIVVLVKYVPEPQGTPTLGDDLLLVREGVDGALDPGDEFAIEAALQLAESEGGEVTLVSMGPEVAQSALRKGFS